MGQENDAHRLPNEKDVGHGYAVGNAFLDICEQKRRRVSVVETEQFRNEPDSARRERQHRCRKKHKVEQVLHIDLAPGAGNHAR
nr:hypothetical protein [Mesorhizobium sp. CO1-1-8]